MQIKSIGVTGFILALGLLIPGLFLDMLTITMDARVQAGGLIDHQVDLLNETRSILGTVSHLWGQNMKLVAFLILFFSAIVPVLKLLGTALYCFTDDEDLSRKLKTILGLVAKWSMADVFVVGVLIAYLSVDASNASEFKAAVFGMQINVNLTTQSQGELLSGFYYFVAYCMVSIAHTQLVFALKKPKTPS